MMKRQALRKALHRMPPVKMYQIHMLICVIHLHGHGALDRHRIFAFIFKPHCPGDHIQVIEYPVKQMDLKIRDPVIQRNVQGLCLILCSKHARQALKRIFAF